MGPAGTGRGAGYSRDPEGTPLRGPEYSRVTEGTPPRMGLCGGGIGGGAGPRMRPLGVPTHIPRVHLMHAILAHKS